MKYLILLIVFILGIIGSFGTKAFIEGNVYGGITVIIVSLCACLLWLGLVKTNQSLLSLTAAWDTVFSASYFIGFLIIGERRNTKQWIGIIFAMVRNNIIRINRMTPILIAEVKRKSKFGFRSNKSFKHLFSIANKHGNWISIHTSPDFGGSLNFLEKARDSTDKPIIAKGFHDNTKIIEKCLKIGAQLVLTTDYVPPEELVDFCLLEMSTIEKVIEASEKYPFAKFVYNNRNLKTGERRTTDHYDLYREACNWLCEASLMKSIKDIHQPPIHRYPEAILVGQNLETFVNE